MNAFQGQDLIRQIQGLEKEATRLHQENLKLQAALIQLQHQVETQKEAVVSGAFC